LGVEDFKPTVGELGVDVEYVFIVELIEADDGLVDVGGVDVPFRSLKGEFGAECEFDWPVRISVDRVEG